MLLYRGRASLAYLRDHGVGGNDVLHFLGPGVHETEPSTPQRDKGAVFDFKLVTVGVDLLSHLQHYGHTHQHHDEQQACRLVWSVIFEYNGAGTLPVALRQVADVILVEILIKGSSEQLLRQVA